jgi:ABC-type bacteriocin/lantibiotic exporter with double-glycine peptidase domain
MYNAKQLDSGKFVPMFIIVLYILNSMIYTNDQFRDIVFDWGIINATDNIIGTPSPPRQSNTPNIQLPSTGLGLYDVDFKYDTSRHNVINMLNIHINENEKVVIMGDIGSGKSTVLKLLLKYYEPHNGVIYWRGKSYNDIDLRHMRRTIGYVPQTPILFNRSVLENIAYGNNFPRHKIVEILNDYDIMKEFGNLEMGIDTPIGKNGSRLSGGQRQLVWCLRVLLNNPEVLILDEPTSSIDHKTKETLNRLLDVVMKDKIVIMVTHDEYLLQKADRLIVMEKGSVAKDMYIKKV